MGWDWSFSLMRYGQKWRDYRRVFQHYFNVISEHRAIQLPVSDDLLKRLHRDPKNFLHHMKQYVHETSVFR